MHHIARAALGCLLLSEWGCGLIGPSCVGRQQRGTVTVVMGEVAAGDMVRHRLPYDIEGSQNDVAVDWAGRDSPGGPTLQIYATRVECEGFDPASSHTGACTVLARAGVFAGSTVRSLVITHGRGNPEILGTPPEYILWIVGDPTQAVRYSLTATWFRGPDC